MQISQDFNRGLYYIHSYSPGEIRVNDQLFHKSIILSPNKLIENWPPQSISQLTLAHLPQTLDLAPEIVLVGYGENQYIPEPKFLAFFYEKNIGVEFMDTRSACRTFNVLSSEDRKVVAALLLS